MSGVANKKKYTGLAQHLRSILTALDKDTNRSLHRTITVVYQVFQGLIYNSTLINASHLY